MLLMAIVATVSPSPASANRRAPRRVTAQLLARVPRREPPARERLVRHPPRVSLVITGENLLDPQLGEPDNVAVLPGPTICGGLRAKS
jgi:hypothetical protein